MRKWLLVAFPLLLVGMIVTVLPGRSASALELTIYPGYPGGVGISVYRPRAEVYVWPGRRGMFYTVVPYSIPYTVVPGIYAYSPLATGAFRGRPLDPRDLPQAYPAGPGALLYRQGYLGGADGESAFRGGVDPVDRPPPARIPLSPRLAPPPGPEAVPTPTPLEDAKPEISQYPPRTEKPSLPDGPREF